MIASESRVAWTLLCTRAERLLDSELARLMLQIVGVVLTTVAIGLLVPFATDPDDEPRATDDRPDRAFP